jgi:hypothetical protein
MGRHKKTEVKAPPPLAAGTVKPAPTQEAEAQDGPVQTQEKPPVKPAPTQMINRQKYLALSEIFGGGRHCLQGSMAPSGWPEEIQKDLLAQNAIKPVE